MGPDDAPQQNQSIIRPAFLVAMLMLAVFSVGVFGEPKHAIRSDAQAQLALSIPDAGAVKDAANVSGTTAPADAPAQTTVCSGGEGDPAVCTSRYVTRYVEQQGGSPKETFCAISPKAIQEVCAGASTETECAARVEQLVSLLTEARGARGVAAIGEQCTNSYRGALTCFNLFSTSPTVPTTQQTQTFIPNASDSQLAAAVIAQSSGGGMKCCKAGDTQCENDSLASIGAGGGSGQGSLLQDVAYRPSGSGQTGTSDPALKNAVDAAYSSNGELGQNDVSQRATDVGVGGQANTTAQQSPNASAQQSSNTSNANTPVIASNQRPQAANTTGQPTRGGAGVAQNNTNTGVLGQNSGYQSLQQHTLGGGPPQSLTGSGGGLGSFLRGFLGEPTPTYQSPQGQAGGQAAPYGGPITIPQPTQQLRTVQEIASDVAAQTQTNNLPRVDHFAQTLSQVGGPSTSANINTENVSYGRIQDLIVEDEAIRALRVAEEEGTRAKNSVFCRANETSQNCQVRRQEKAEQVERDTFVKELEDRVLPQQAVQHFLAVYDGWVRPSPAPPTRATSTLGAIFQSEQENAYAAYERETGGNNFVLWIVENVKDVTKNIVDAATNLLIGSGR